MSLRDQEIQDQCNDFHLPLERGSGKHAAGLSAKSPSLKPPKLPLAFSASTGSLQQQQHNFEQRARFHKETTQKDTPYYQLGRPLSASVPNFKTYVKKKEQSRVKERLAVQTKFPEQFYEENSYGEIDDLFALYEEDSESDPVSSPVYPNSTFSPVPSQNSMPLSIPEGPCVTTWTPHQNEVPRFEGLDNFLAGQSSESLANSPVYDVSVRKQKTNDKSNFDQGPGTEQPLYCTGQTPEITSLFYEPPFFMTVSPNSERDQYGFRKATAYVTQKEYDSWYRDYQVRVRERKKKWDGLLRESGIIVDRFIAKYPPKSSKVRRYIRKGIPPEYRGGAWFYYAGGPAKLAAHPGLYRSLVIQSSSLHTPDSEIIERDLHRTFPDCALFRPPDCRDSKLVETPIIQALRRVLRAFAYYCPRVGYCQSINFITGIFLLFMDEERAFWMLYITTQEYLPGVHDVNLEGANIDQAVLCMLIKETQPAIWSKLGGGLDDPNSQTLEDIALTPPPVTLVTASWFMSMFCGILPWESLLRVWDCFFFEGSKILFKIAMTIFKYGEQEILGVTEPTMIFQVVQALPKRWINAGDLLEACFRRRSPLGDSITQRQVDQKRRQVSSKRQQGKVSKLGYGDSKRSKSAVRGA